eukprot:m.5528 g.5528  ORF g.5528 m.5528 type:complete len:1333 (+) comp13436_c0_seq2:121-4119(+)
MGSSSSCVRSPTVSGRRNRVRPIDCSGVHHGRTSLTGASPRFSFARLASVVPTGLEERWQFVEMTCDGEKSHAVDHTRDWKTLRLFVSSTFSDFHSEREVLANQVFPELHEWCEARRLHFIATDLHWGLDKEPRSKESLEASLREIERCREDGGGFFFLALLSDLIGWIPTADEMSESAAGKYGWIQGLSMQELEIVNGAYRDGNPGAGFFVRDPASLIGLPNDVRSQFVDSTPEAKARREVLLTKLKDKFPNQIKQYKCWILQDESYAMGHIKLQGLEVFARSVTEHFKERISKQFPEKTASPWRSINVQRECSEENLVTSIWSAHKNVIDGESGEPCFGHGHLEKQVLAYVNGRGTGTPFLLSGNVGEGKSSVVSHCILHLQKQESEIGSVPFMGRPSCKIFYHFVGSLPGSRNLRQLLWRLWHFEPLGTSDSLPTDINVLAREIGLKLSCSGTDRMVLFFNQLDMLEDGQSAHALKWLPAKLPDSLKIVVTLNSDSETAKILRSRKPAPVEVFSTLQERSLGADVVHSVLRKHSLWLNDTHLKVLAEKHGSNNLMYLNEACKEILQYPNEETDHVLLGLPQDLNGLMDKLLVDCETCHGGRLVIAALCLMACSRNGVLETELLDMLGALSAAAGPSRTVSEVVEGQGLLCKQAGTEFVPFITGGIIPFMDWNRSQCWDGENASSSRRAVDADSIVPEEAGPPVDRDGADSGIGTNSGAESRKISGIGPEIGHGLMIPRLERRSSGSSCASASRGRDFSRRGSYGAQGLNSSSSSLTHHPPGRRSSLNGLSQLSFADQASDGDVSSLASSDRPHRLSASLRHRRQSLFSAHPPPSPRLFPAQWIHVNAGLRNLFKDSGCPGEGRLNFGHQAIRDAVVRSYFRCTPTSSFPFTFCTSSTFYGADEPSVASSHEDILRCGGRSTRTLPFRPLSACSDADGLGLEGDAFRHRDFVESEIERQRFLWWHARLAGYFEQSTDHARRAEELPFHLLKIGDRAKLARCLAEWPIFDYLSTDENVMDLIHYWRAAGGAKAAAVRYNEALENLAASPDASEEEVALRRERVAFLLSKMNERDEGCKLLNEALEAEEQQLGSRPERVADLTLAIASLMNDTLRETDQLATELEKKSDARCEIMEFARRSADVRKTLLDLRGNKMESSERRKHWLDLAKAKSLLSFHQIAVAMDQCGETALERARVITQECINLYGELGCTSLQIESWLSLAVTYNESPRQMLNCFEEALRLCSRVFGQRHEMAARIHLSMALLYDCRMERPGVALTHYKRWLTTNEQVLGVDHPKTIQSRNTVAQHLMTMGRDKEAEKFRVKGVGEEKLT